MSKQPLSENRKPYISRFFKSPGFLLCYVGIALLSAVLIKGAARFVETEYLFYGFLTAAFLVALILITSILFNSLKTSAELETKITNISKLSANHAMNWLVDQNYISTIGQQSDETWTFATELTYAIQPDSTIFKGAERNLARGASYKFFMPDRPRVHKIVADYKRLHNFAPGQVEFILIPNSEFLFHTVIALYNVRSERPRAIEWIPNRGVDAWIEMDEEHAQKMAGIGEVLVRKYADRYSSQHTADPKTLEQKDI